MSSDSDSDVFFDAEDSILVRLKPINTDEKFDEKEDISTSESSLKENVFKLPQLTAKKKYLIDEELMTPLLDLAECLQKTYRKNKDNEQCRRKVEETRTQMFSDDEEILEIHSEQSSIASSSVEGFNHKSNSNYVLQYSERNDTSSVISSRKVGSILGESDSVLSKDPDAVSIDSKYPIETKSVRELNVPPLANSQGCEPDVVASTKTDQAQYPVAPPRTKEKKNLQSCSEAYRKAKDNEQRHRKVEELRKQMFNDDDKILEINSKQSSIASSSVEGFNPKSNSNYVLKYGEGNDTSSVISLRKVGSILGERDSALSEDADAASIDSEYSFKTESVRELNVPPLPNSQGCEPDVVASTKTDQAQYPVALPRTKKQKNLQSSSEAYRKTKDNEQRHCKVEKLRKQMFNDDDEILEINSKQSSIASSSVEGVNPKSNSKYVLKYGEGNDTSSVISLRKVGSILGERDSVLSKDADAVSIDSKYSIETESVRELNVPPLPNSEGCEPDVVASAKTDQAQYPVAPPKRKKKKNRQSSSVQTEKTKDADLDINSHSKPSDKTDTSKSEEKDPNSKTSCASDERKKKITYLYQSIVKPFGDKSGKHTSQTTLANTKRYGYSSSSAGGLSGSNGSGLYLVGGYRKSPSRDNGQKNTRGYINASGIYYSTGFLGEFSAANPGKYTRDNIRTYSVWSPRQFGEMNCTSMADMNEMNIPRCRRNMIGGYSAVPVERIGNIGGMNEARAGGTTLGEYSTGMTREIDCLGLAGPGGSMVVEYSIGMTGVVSGLDLAGSGGNKLGEYSASLPGNIGLNSASPSRNVFGGYNSGMSRDFGGMNTAGSDRNNLGRYNSSMLSGFCGKNTVGSDRNSIREYNPGMARDFSGMNPVGSDRNSLREYHSGMTRGFGGRNLVGSVGNILRQYDTRVSGSLGNLVGTSSPRYGGNMFRNQNPGQMKGINRVTHNDSDWNRFGEYQSYFPENNNVMCKSDKNVLTEYNPSIMRGMNERDFAKFGKDKLEGYKERMEENERGFYAVGFDNRDLLRGFEGSYTNRLGSMSKEN